VAGKKIHQLASIEKTMTSSSQTRIEILKKYLEEEPQDIFTRYALALEYSNGGAFNDARDLFLPLTNEKYLPAFYQLGKVYEKLNDISKAKAIYESGVEVAKEKRDFHTLNELNGALAGIGEDN
jgi:tetratricopeptide (TPR) repeat protein